MKNLMSKSKNTIHYNCFFPLVVYSIFQTYQDLCVSSVVRSLAMVIDFSLKPFKIFLCNAKKILTKIMF